MVTDTADLRNPHYHRPDTPDRLDLPFLGKVVETVGEAVAQVAR